MITFSKNCIDSTNSVSDECFYCIKPERDKFIASDTFYSGKSSNLDNNLIDPSAQPEKKNFKMIIKSQSPVPQMKNENCTKRSCSQDNLRSGSLTDSEESESSLSCDSLNFVEFARRTTWNSTLSKLTYLPDSLLRDIRDCKLNSSSHVENKTMQKSKKKFTTKINFKYSNKEQSFLDNLEESNNSCVLVQHNGFTTEQFENKEKIFPKTYENDKFYTFHVNEKNLQCLMDSEPKSLEDESFAGYKDIRSATSTIRSNKGTVRGVKNRVRNGIATFLQIQKSNLTTFKEKDCGKVVVFTTSMGIIRETFAKCSNIKKILRTLLIKFDERDIFMSAEYQQEIKERMQSDEIDVPQLFVEGQYIGDAEIVERLNESGELRQMLQAYKTVCSSFTCQACGGYRLLPCPSCNGSKKSVHRNHFTAEFVALKCMNCDEVGLIKCHHC